MRLALRLCCPVVMPLLWLGELRIRLIARRQVRRAFYGRQLTPKARRQLAAPAKRRTP